MKIERIAENKIKCTLSREDLESHDIVLTEFAYGSEKAKEFFRDLMLQAEDEVDFEVDESPLMIEAIPLNQDSIVLIVTKVSSTEELNSRMSGIAGRLSELRKDMGEDSILDVFTDSDSDDDDDEDDDLIYDIDSANEDSSNVIEISAEVTDDAEDSDDDSENDMDDASKLASDFIRSTIESIAKNAVSQVAESVGFTPLSQNVERVDGRSKGKNTFSDNKGNNLPKPPKQNITVFFEFRKLDDVCDVARSLAGCTNLDNTLYKDMVSGMYFLVLSKGDMSTDRFTVVINRLGEYGRRLAGGYAFETFLEEHYMCVIRSNALQMLGE